MKRVLAVLLAFPALLWSQTESTADLLDRLARDSPFLPATGVTVAGPVSNSQFEFRSVVVENGTLYFSVYDSGRQRSEWVSLDQGGGPFVARRYDAERDTLTIERDGRTETLPLKESRVHGTDNAPAGPPAPLPTNTPPTNNPPAEQPKGGPPVPTPGAGLGGGAPPAPTLSNPQEAERLQNLANEIRRRRGLREMPPANPPRN